MNITTLNSNPQYKFQTQKKMTNLSFKGVDKSLTQDVLEIKGSQTKAKVFTNNIDYQTFGQIKNICSLPVFIAPRSFLVTPKFFETLKFIKLL